MRRKTEFGREMREFKHYYPAEHLRGWRLGLLQQKWYSQARNTFCEIDLANASGDQRKKGYHFGEWFVARHYLRLGYQVLPEKYLLPSRERALKKATKLLGPDGVYFLSRERRLDSKLRWSPHPDLLVFKSNHYFFVEVKRHPDKLSPAQKEFFPVIEKRFDCAVLVVTLWPSHKPAKDHSYKARLS
jgi:hypothetical protein